MPRITRACDICQRQASETPVVFGWQLTNYEIDLCLEHIEQISQLLDEYVAAARRLGEPARGFQPERSDARDRDLVPTRAVRTWAKKTGRPVPDRGRLPDALFTEYLNENRSSAIDTAKEN